MNKASKAFLTVWKVIAALCGVMFLLTFAIPFAAFAVIITIAVAVLSGTAKADPNMAAKQIKSVSAVLAVMLLIGFSMPPIGISSPFKWQYPIQRFYTGLYHNEKEPDYFGDFLGDVQSDYKFEYLPSIMQGTGYYSVTFTTSPERAAEYAAEFAPKAQYTISLAEYIDSDIYYIGERDPAMKNVLDVYVSESMKNGCSDKAKIYVLSAVLNFNHPHSSAVIVDTETGKVQLSQLG